MAKQQQRLLSLSRPLKLLVCVLLLFVFGAGLYGLIVSTPDFIRGYQVRSADRTTEGTVTAKTSDGAKYANQAKNNSEKAYATANVDYSVDGQTYSASHTVYTPVKGETITLYYDPAHPEDTFTEVEVLFAKYYWMRAAFIAGTGTILILLGLFSLRHQRMIATPSKNQKK